MSATTNLDTDLTDREAAADPTAPTIVRDVQFVCPSCGDDRQGRHVEPPAGDAWVECDHCNYRCDPGVLEIPTEATLTAWHAQALRHAQAALRCADGSPTCSYLAIVWCRRLAPELSPWGKAAFLDDVTRPLDGQLTREQREVVLALGVALQMSPTAINRFLDAV